MKKALIFGLTGQDGSYLAELLIEKGYEVHGIIRRSSSINTPRIDHIMHKIKTYYGDVTDCLSVNNIIKELQPDELYNLSAQSHVKVSFEIPYYTAQVDAIGTLNILEACRINSPHTKIYQASTSEMFGGVGYNMPKTGYTEQSPFHPRSPYGCAKLYSYWIIRNYREAYKMFTCNGLLFNHESPRRGDTFVTKKITNWCTGNKNLLQAISGNYSVPIEPLTLGNLNAYRDWGHAKDYVNAMWLMLQQNKPEDYVIATGETHTVKEFIELCFKEMDIKLQWDNQGVNEVGRVNGEIVIKVDPKYFRPSEVDILLGDPSKARKELNWKPEYSFVDLVKDMMNDYRRWG